MDNARARELVEAGAFVLALDFPARTGFGMDYGSWGVGESFKGMKMIPPGCHYIHVSQGAIHASAVEGKRGGRGKDPPARLGFFCWLRQGEVLVLRWDAFLEAPVVVAESTEQQKLAHAVRGYEYDQFLAPYPMEHLSKWDALTSRVSRELISKLGVVGKWLSAAPRDDAREAQDAEEGVESKETGEGGSEDRERRALLFGHPQYATVPARLPTARIRALLKSAQLAPAQVTQMHMDKTYVLEYVLETAGYSEHKNEGMLLGELQFAFVGFYIGQSFTGFAHWKALVVMLCGCDRAAEERRGLFKTFVLMLIAQLKEVPTDFFNDPLAEDNFLKQCLIDLYEILSESCHAAEYAGCVAELQRIVQERFRWDLGDELVRAMMSVDGPTIVE